MDVEKIRRKLIEAGANPKVVQELEPEDLEPLDSEDANFEFLAKVLNFLDAIENVERYRRKRINITLAEPVHELLKYIASGIVDSEGKPYPVSYLMEDMVIWVMKDLDRFNDFLKDTYTEEEEEEDLNGSEEEEIEGEES